VDEYLFYTLTTIREANTMINRGTEHCIFDISLPFAASGFSANATTTRIHDRYDTICLFGIGYPC